MYALRPATSPLSAIVRLTRTLHTTPQPLASQPESASKPQMTQTHSTRKSQDPMHKDADIGSGYVRAGRSAREGAESSSSGEAEPFDAARQGNPGGEVKQSTAQSDVAGTGDARMSGSFKDQVGGQDERDKGPGVFSGEKERAAAHGLGQTMGDSIKGSFDGLKEMRSEKKNFHTSSRNLADPPRPDSNVEASRQPKEKDLHGQQNEHLKHKPAEEADKGKGNASPDPHLPSKSASTGTGSGTRAFSTSTWVGATKPPGGYAKAFSPEATRAGYDAPPEALPDTLSSAYTEQDPSAIQPPPPGTTPKSEMNFSSTSSDPPHDVLRQGALDGTLPEKNAPPSAEVGKLGNQEAWKHRK